MIINKISTIKWSKIKLSIYNGYNDNVKDLVTQAR